MATLLARYLINEGSGSTIADASGNGHPLTLTDTGNGGWDLSTMANGTSIYSGAVGDNNVKAQNDNLPLLLASLGQVTAVMAIQDMEGTSSYHRMWIMSQSASNGILGATLGGTETLEGRWNYEDGITNTVRYRWYADDWAPVGSMGDNQVLIMEFDGQAAAGSRQTIWSDNVVLSSNIEQESGTSTLPPNMSPYQFCLLNRPNMARACKGNMGYFELWDGKLTAQERADATTNLLVDCDTAWDAAPPPTSVSFTSEPSATNIDTDSVTANATAESDAPQ